MDFDKQNIAAKIRKKLITSTTENVERTKNSITVIIKLCPIYWSLKLYSY